MKNIPESKSALPDALKARAIIQSLRWSWLELRGDEVEALLEMAAVYADSVTQQLNSRNADGERVNGTID